MAFRPRFELRLQDAQLARYSVGHRTMARWVEQTGNDPTSTTPRVGGGVSSHLRIRRDDGTPLRVSDLAGRFIWEHDLVSESFVPGSWPALPCGPWTNRGNEDPRGQQPLNKALLISTTAIGVLEQLSSFVHGRWSGTIAAPSCVLTLLEACSGNELR